jgi:3-phosphoshikimate 1-carboxyvinyltransferase
MSITISHPTSIFKGNVNLPLSKSETNRILILQALSKGRVGVGNISGARDTKLLQSALAADVLEINIQDAGTSMRFLTAYYCATGQHKILTGSERMQERPISILVEALRDIGFNIEYLKNPGFPPLEITPADLSKLKSEVSIVGNISSQYISALMMIAPILPQGLVVNFTTSLSSKPYLDLTRQILSDGGIACEINANSITILHQSFKPTKLEAGADWSSASYWCSMAALSSGSGIFLSNLQLDSDQGDKIIAEWIKYFGIQTIQTFDGITLNSIHSENPVNSALLFDFTHYPDLAQTMIVLCAAKNVKATFTGLKSLRIKETDRIVALQNELIKFGVSLKEYKEGNYKLTGDFAMSNQIIATYNDHRMAMAFAPLALLGKITIEQPEVVEKSYPDFWKEMERVGFEITSDTPPQS